MKIWPGWPAPLGATWDGHGVNFALFSEHATAAELCLFDGAGVETRVRLPELTDHVWHGYVPEVGPGQLYGYRVHGPFDPLGGHRFNPAKLLIDPYALALAGTVDWRAPVFGYPLGNPRAWGNPLAEPRADLGLDDRDDAWGVPRSVVVDPRFDWGDDRPPRVPWARSVIYEVHVKGFTARHPEVEPGLRGTYAGLASPTAIRHLVELGVTAVELLPIHASLDDKFLVDRGLTNYWGYSTLGYFAPEARYSASGGHSEQVHEFKAMVRALHQAGLEVILDVVYNHTAEGHQLGPTLSFKGIDNRTYYRLRPDNPRHYADYSGCGNTLDVRHPQVLKLIMDSLRYWVLEMHVDGFRFDLAPALAREDRGFDRLASFFDVVHQDPVLSRVKLIAEPWDIGEGGYQVGSFPPLWTEWNDKYRDGVRAFWRGDERRAGEMASRLTGSADLYQVGGRRPYASINFVTAHDGFTLADLVSYDRKHNEANGEENRDGTDHNLSWNHGVEGPTEAPEITALRARQQRSFLATLLFSQGVPMLLGGDELGRTQRGNNNAYCQDNDVSWFDWDLDDRRQALLEFARRVIRIRAEQPALRRRTFFRGRQIREGGPKDLTWLTPSGEEVSAAAWANPAVRALGLRIAGERDDLDERGELIVGDSLLLLLNAHPEPLDFRLTLALPTASEARLAADVPPGSRVAARLELAGGRLVVAPSRTRRARWSRAGGDSSATERWELIVDTAHPELGAGDLVRESGAVYRMEGRALALFRLLADGR